MIEGLSEGLKLGFNDFVGSADGMEETLGDDDGISGKDISPPPHQQHASKGVSPSSLVKVAS